MVGKSETATRLTFSAQASRTKSWSMQDYLQTRDSTVQMLHRAGYFTD
jgi:hypothetical protein